MDLKRYHHNRIILCCNILPVDIKFNTENQQWECQMDTSSIYEKGSMYVEIGRVLKAKSDINVIFVGCTKTYIPKKDQMRVERKLEQLNCYPIWVDKDLASRYYQGYCSTILFPVFHNIVELHGHHLGKERVTEQVDTWNWMPNTSYSISEAAEFWEDYCEVNRRFSLRVVQLFQKGDVVWVHDYHLLVLPSYLFRKITVAPVVFFLHAPFPSTECFRILSHREEILKALLCSDMVGFHSYNYTRSFLLCCKRMLGLKCEPQIGAVVEVHYQSRSVRVLSSLVALQPDFVTKLLPPSLSEPGRALEFHNDCRKAHNIPNDKFVFLGIDELHAISGITARLLSIWKFLTLYRRTEFARKMFFKIIAVTPDNSPDKYQAERTNIDYLVEKINTKFGLIVDFSEVLSMPLSTRIELYNASDCLLLTSVSRRLSTIPFEYRYATRYHPGCILISEFDAAARVLPGSITFSPLKGAGFSEAIADIIAMSMPERMARSSRDLFSINKTLHDWCWTILLNTFEAAKRNLLNSKTPEVFGLGLNIMLMDRKSRKRGGLKWLSSAKLYEAYTKSSHRLIIFDYSGTLVEVSSLASEVKDGGEAKTWHYEDKGYKAQNLQSTSPSMDTRQLLSPADKANIIQLASNPNNYVVIVSTDLRTEVEHIAEDIPNLILVAENGYVFKMNDSDTWESVIDEQGSGMWYSNQNSSSGTQLANITMPDNPELLDVNWQKDILEFMDYYRHLINGSYCWATSSSVIFNFYLADPEWGSIAADSLYKGLEDELAGLPLSMEKGKGFVTVRLAGVNRGAATAAILSKINRKLSLLHEKKEVVDFIFCAGDDIEDEVNFETIVKYKKKENREVKLFNTRVGFVKPKQTRAKYFVDEPSDLLEILRDLVHSKGSEFNKNAIDASNFITKRSMLNLNMNTENSSTTLETVESFETGFTATPKAKGPTVTFDLQEKWGNSESWALDPDNKAAKSSGLRAKAPLKKKKSGLRKNVSFKDVREGAMRRDSVAFEQQKMKNQSSPDLTLLAQKQTSNSKRKVMAHSPSYIATPEELEELFGGVNKLSFQKGPLETKLGANTYDVSIPDRRKIPPTVKNFEYDLTASVERSRLNSVGVSEKGDEKRDWSVSKSTLVFGAGVFIGVLFQRLLTRK